MTEETYYLRLDGQRRGPYRKDELPAAGVRPDTPVWSGAHGDWVAAGDLPDLADLFAAPPAAGSPPAPPLPPAPYTPGAISRLARVGAACYVPAAALLLVAAGLGLAVRDMAPLTTTPRYDPAARVLREEPNALHERQGWLALAALAAAVAGAPLAAAAGVCYAVLFYRAWVVIQDGAASHRPREVVIGFLIPALNLLWPYVTRLQLPGEMNRFLLRHRLDAPFASGPLGLALCLYEVGAVLLPGAGRGAAALLAAVALPLYFHAVGRTAAALCERRPADPEDPGPDVRAVPPLVTAGRLLLILALPTGLGLFLHGAHGQVVFDVAEERAARLLPAYRAALDDLRRKARDGGPAVEARLRQYHDERDRIRQGGPGAGRLPEICASGAALLGLIALVLLVTRSPGTGPAAGATEES